MALTMGSHPHASRHGHLDRDQFDGSGDLEFDLVVGETLLIHTSFAEDHEGATTTSDSAAVVSLCGARQARVEAEIIRGVDEALVLEHADGSATEGSLDRPRDQHAIDVGR